MCGTGLLIRRLKSLAVWDTTHKYERVDVGVLYVHYSRLSLFLPICFLFEPVVGCTTSLKTDVVPFQRWVLQEQLIQNDRLFWENSDTLK